MDTTANGSSTLTLFLKKSNYKIYLEITFFIYGKNKNKAFS